MTEKKSGISRRSFLHGVAQAGGIAALYETMTTLGWLPIPAAFAGPPQLPEGSGTGKRVAILGAGVAGLTAALRLQEAGYECVILEAQGRTGGRNHTVRRGDYVYEKEGFQICDFDDDPGLYFNMGPARIAHHHDALIELCRELGVKLEVYVLHNRGAKFLHEEARGDSLVNNRQIVNDTRGYVAELLSKAVIRGSLDSELSYEDRTRLLDLLTKFGDLKDHYQFRGTGNSGYLVKPGAGTESGEIIPPMSLTELLDFDFWNDNFYRPEHYDWQPTMFEPRGGMDKIVDGLKNHVGHLVHHNKEVCNIMNRQDEVQISYKDIFSGQITTTGFDYCISTIPLPILRRIASNFSQEFTEAMYDVEFSKSSKVGWQAEHRFWEDESIFGGITWTNMTIDQIWYPSNDYFAEKGILVGAYNVGDDAVELGNLTFERRLEVAREQGTLIHPQFNDYVRKGMSIAWQKVPHQEGGWAEWQVDESENRTAGYALLNRPEGRVYLSGSQMSYLTGWQEGAVLSAYKVVSEIGVRTESES